METAASPSIDIPLREVHRYLGYRGVSPSEEMTAHITPCLQQLTEKSRLSAVWICEFLRHAHENAGQTDRHSEEHLQIADLDIVSKGLSRNMRGCDRAVMMAVTIGPGVDFLIRRAETVSMVDAAIYQAAGAAYVEAWCNEVNRRICAFMEQKGRYGHPRFSPGYGDLPLSLQKDFSRILDMPKNCGISLTDTLLMMPSKSVTAFIGFSPKKEPCVPAGCASCENASKCEYRLT